MINHHLYPFSGKLFFGQVVLFIEFLNRVATGAKGWHREEAHHQVQDGRSPQQCLIAVMAGRSNDNLPRPQEKPLLRVTNNHANETLKIRLGRSTTNQNWSLCCSMTSFKASVPAGRRKKSILHFLHHQFCFLLNENAFLPSLVPSTMEDVLCPASLPLAPILLRQLSWCKDVHAARLPFCTKHLSVLQKMSSQFARDS